MSSKFYQFLRPIYAPLMNQWLINRRIRAKKQAILRVSRNKSAIKLVIGAGDTTFKGWLSTDYPILDVTNAQHWHQFFSRSTIRRILAEHVFEHLTVEQLKTFLNVVRPYLTPDANIRIAVPDGNHPEQKYIEYVEPDGKGDGADDHKVLYTYQLLQDAIETEGYRVVLLEYYDEKGTFHEQPWDEADGDIKRSKRNQLSAADSPPGRPLNYTSLIVDCSPQ